MEDILKVKNQGNGTVVQTILTQPLYREQVVITISMAFTLTLGFYITDRYMAMQLLKGGTFWSPALPWDELIPFDPSWVWIYFLYFPICFLPIVFQKVWQDVGLFRRTALGFAIQFIIALSVFWIFPSRMERLLFEQNSFSGQALSWFYKIDLGFNIFPSLHVANVSYIALLAWKLKSGFVSIAIWILCALIATSTLFVKQHYLLDLPVGALVGILGYFAAFSDTMKFLDSTELWPSLLKK